MKKNRVIKIYSHDEVSGKVCIEESPIFFEIDRQTDPEVLEELTESIKHILTDVRVVVDDWIMMRDKVKAIVNELDVVKEHLDLDEVEETQAFLGWLKENHFTFLGIRDYELVTEKNEKVLRLIPKSGLGVLREANHRKTSRRVVTMTPEARRLTLSSQILIMSKTNTRSTVHRPAYTDYIGIKRFDKKGNVIGERRIIGLYTSAAYNTNPKHIPFLRHKVATIIRKSKLKPSSHAGKVLLNILETFPRDDLFQASSDELLEISMGIFYLQERRRIRLFARKDIYGRFVSCLVYVPRERFNTELRLAMQKILKKELHGIECIFSTRFSDSVLARIHFIVRIDPKEQIEYDVKEIEKKLIEVGRSWKDDLADNLLEYHGEEKGNYLMNLYGNAFPAGYREYFSPIAAAHDIGYIENLSETRKLELNFYKPIDDISCDIRFKVYQFGETIPLSDVLPILENMGLRVISERPHEILLNDGSCVWINDFGMFYQSHIKLDINTVKEIFQESFSKIWFSEVENDGFNRLVLSAGLHWREITVLRAYAKYFRQTGFTFSQTYIETTLNHYPNITQLLMKLFLLRFEPTLAAKNASKITNTVKRIKTEIENVASLDDDRILSRYFDLIQATVRTNYFQLDEKEQPKTYLSLKLKPELIPDLPLPRPMFEVFVYSPRFEGVHLRGAKVARGGIRWSDRREDFRTEILGLMKAQQVKNAVIVPLGAKGGFVPKYLPTNGKREEIMKEGIACYKEFIHGLLDITDNLKGGKVITPAQVYRYDKDDPYLVVAADKGTATFSDIANSISKEYDFWLSDAFASGGSAGYDHKKMGITARGAWESVKRHFRELNIDIQTTDFTCIGIGDMAGDVFGNGMLLSNHIKLIAVFNHMHIFLDPNPNPEISFKERKRLFNLPRSTWADYDTSLLSKGGGIYSRTLKAIQLSPEVQKILDVDNSELTPNNLIKAILKAPVDLFWNGGIGTFVKAREEADAEVGDKTNDTLRVNAIDLRCKVVGEGGNLGITQRARIEAALNGIHLYTDFIDNSGGVDCSDHEVNIKILLDNVVANGDMTEKQRNNLLVKMTDEVAALVLKDNYQQTQAISLTAENAAKHIDLHSRYIDELEKLGKLNRALEFLPDAKALAERKLAGKGLTRSGIAVLLAYSKILLKENILGSDVPEDPYLSNMLELAFPMPLRKKFRAQMDEHPLRREIIAMQVVNKMIDEMGFSFVYRLRDETGAPDTAIVRAYFSARTIFNFEYFWREIEKLDNKVPVPVQFTMMRSMIHLIRRTTRWFLKNRRMSLDIATTINEFQKGISELIMFLPERLVGEDLVNYNNKLTEYKKLGINDEVGEYLAVSDFLLSSLDVIAAVKENNLTIKDVAGVYFAIDEYLDLGWIRTEIAARSVESHWDALSREALRDDLDWQQRLLSVSILQYETKTTNIDKRINAWMEEYQMLVERWKHILSDLRASASMNFTMFFVAVRELLDLTQTTLQTTTICAVPKAKPKSKARTQKKTINKDDLPKS